MRSYRTHSLRLLPENAITHKEYAHAFPLVEPYECTPLRFQYYYYLMVFWTKKAPHRINCEA